MQAQRDNDSVKDSGGSSTGLDDPMAAREQATILNIAQPTFHGSRGASHIGRKPAFGQTCSMKTLLQDGILQTGEKVLTLEYEGRKFHGDLRRDGTIMMRGLDDAPHIYATPVAWANHCCKMLNPESKPLSAWSSIRFRGKRLDSYKLKWYRAQKNNKMNDSNSTSATAAAVAASYNNVAPVNYNHVAAINYNQNNIDEITKITNSKNTCTSLMTNVINYEQLGTRGPHNTHNPNTMVKCIPFSAVNRIQPFDVTVSTNALLLVDFHSHLVHGEVAGYLAGSWDPGQHMLTITQAFPCKTSIDNEQTATNVEDEIRQEIEKRNLTLVGWYHSHRGKYSNFPTINDIQHQIKYQIIMKEAPGGYTPCVGLICAPHDIRSEDDLSPSFQIYWVMPPPEHLGNHYGRPMQMYYSVTRDLFLTQDLLLEMRLLANYYTSNNTDMVDFKSTYEHNDKITNLDKLSGSIKPKLPKDLQEREYPDEPNIWKAAIDHFWKFLRNLVVPPAEDEEKDEEEVEEQEEDQEQEQSITDGNSAGEVPIENQSELQDSM